jgi:hypothetical protein
MLAGSFSERRVPLQWTCPSFGTRVIDQLYDLASLWRNRGWMLILRPSLGQKRGRNQHQACYQLNHLFSSGDIFSERKMRIPMQRRNWLHRPLSILNVKL